MLIVFTLRIEPGRQAANSMLILIIAGLLLADRQIDIVVIQFHDR